MKDDMIERAAMAAWVAYSVRPEDMESTDEGDYTRERAERDWREWPAGCTHIGADGFRRCARAALEAMREPTADMADAAWMASRFAQPFCRREVSEAAWIAAIDAALSPSPADPR